MEVDIVMDAHTPLYKAHDISERLQSKFEALPHVERAFVHVDYEWIHTPARRGSSCWPPTQSNNMCFRNTVRITSVAPPGVPAELKNNPIALSWLITYGALSWPYKRDLNCAFE